MVLPLSTMMRDAVIHIRQQKGTSLAEIRKHLEALHNKKLDGIDKKLLTSTLTGLVQTGQLQKKGSNYKLAAARRSVPHGDAPSRRHNHCTRPFKYKRGYRTPNRTGHRHCPRRRRRRRRIHERRQHGRHRCRRRRRRHHRHQRRHHHGIRPTKFKHGYQVLNQRNHRHRPRR